jgi:hypothetical protein
MAEAAKNTIHLMEYGVFKIKTKAWYLLHHKNENIRHSKTQNVLKVTVSKGP